MAEIDGVMPIEEVIGADVNIVETVIAQSNPEMIDARRGHDGTEYPTLGEAIRTQVSGLWGEVNSIPEWAMQPTKPTYTAKEVGGATTARFTTVLPVDGWSSEAPFTQTIQVDGLLATDEPFIDVNLEGVSDGTSILEAWTVVGRLSVSADNTLTAYCYEEKPEVDIPVLMKVVR